MQPRAARHAIDEQEPVVVLVALGRGPLLQLKDDVGVLTGSGVAAGEDDVCPLAGQREPVLQKHLDVAEARLEQIAGEDGQAAFPRPDLGPGRVVAGADPHLLGEPHREGALVGQRRHTGGGVTER